MRRATKPIDGIFATSVGSPPMRYLSAIFVCLFLNGVVVMPWLHSSLDGHAASHDHVCSHSETQDEDGGEKNDAAPVGDCAFCAVANVHITPTTAPSFTCPIETQGETLRCAVTGHTHRIDHGPVLSRGPPCIV